MARYNVHEAKSNFSALLDKVQAGETVVIVCRGEPVAELVPPRSPYFGRRRLGFAKGEVQFSPGWERALTENEADAFLEGR